MFSTRDGAGSLMDLIVQNHSHLRQMVSLIHPKQARRGAVLLTGGVESIWLCRRGMECLSPSVLVRMDLEGRAFDRGKGIQGPGYIYYTYLVVNRYI